MCWLFHKWSKWSQYERAVVIYPGLIAPKEIRGKEIHAVEQRQKRVCSVCGKVQDELIYEE